MQKKSDIPFKSLNPKQALDIAEAIARNDSKRLDDVIGRIGGIDSSAFEEVLKARGANLNLIAEKGTSGGLLARALARSPQSVFDWLVRNLPTSKSNGQAWFQFKGLSQAGAFGDPRSMSKLIQACMDAGVVNRYAAAVLGSEIDEGRPPPNPSQAAAWTRAREASRALALDFLTTLTPQMLADMVRATEGSGKEAYPLFHEAAALSEARTLSSASAPAPSTGRPKFL